ncbi:MAG: UDP-glucose/GDP-mannose dehydrogenase family protein [Planctomycetes bacterium]|nr:UDP-glucose/GDP-mannose dehydrogenase family protein [Planctomycetota bacterium]
MRIAVFGTGYVGLVVGTCFAESGNKVTCVDVDTAKIDDLNRGVIPIYEPGLEELVKRNTAEERLSFTTDGAKAVQEALVVFMAVGTPEDQDGSADLQYVLQAAENIGRAMNGYKIIVTKSTVPVGTAEKIRARIRSVTDLEFDVASNPEFLKEGTALDDFLKPDRVVIGTDDVRVAEILKELYQPFVRTGRPILCMDIPSAELTKYASNAMLATRISFMNEIANLCERIGADVNRVREGMASDSRIGFPFLFPGIGYGGSCFPKDVKAIVRSARELGCELQVLDAVEQVNVRQKERLAEKVLAHFAGNVKGKRFALWGLSFKPRTDDMREAPSLEIVRKLIEAGAAIAAFDPKAMPAARRVLGTRVHYAARNYDALDGADALIVATEWNEFRHPDFDEIKKRLKQPVIFDGRNIYDAARVRKQGFVYYGIGVP